MAIQTQGHVVSVMPHVGLADPSLVAFNPQAITGGVLQSIQLANELSRRKAFLNQQAEEDAIRRARIAAINARNQGVVDVTPHTTLADIALADKTSALAPVQTDVGLAQGKGTLADLAFNEQMRPLSQDTTRLLAEATNASAPDQSDVIVQGAKNAAEAARAAAALNPVKNELDLAQTQESLGSLEEDKKRADRLKEAQIKLEEANADYAKAHGEYYLKKSSRTDLTPDEIQKQLAHVETSIRNLKADKFTNPNDPKAMPVPLLQYKGSVIGADGAPVVDSDVLNKITFGLLGSETPRTMDPEAARSLDQLNGLYNLRNQLTKQLTGGGSTSSISLPASVAPAKTSGSKSNADGVFKTPAALLDAVRSGSVSKDAAKAYATQMGWK